MCGVFAYVSQNGEPIAMKILQRIAIETEKRGPHAWGMAWIEPNAFGQPTLRHYKQEGRISDSLGALTMARNATALIGHCRWATHGDPSVNANNHPFHCADGFLVHNGVVGGHEAKAAENGWHLNTDCDSELFCASIEDSDAPMMERVNQAGMLTDHGCVLLGIWKPNIVIGYVNGNPLQEGHAQHGTYLASRGYGLPKNLSPVADGSVFQWDAGHAAV